jgi:hypothetical protein
MIQIVLAGMTLYLDLTDETGRCALTSEKCHIEKVPLEIRISLTLSITAISNFVFPVFAIVSMQGKRKIKKDTK